MKYRLPFNGTRDKSLDDGAVIGFKDVSFKGEIYDYASVDLLNGEIKCLRMEGEKCVGVRARITEIEVNISETLFKESC